jgi:hypothetical protein
MLQCIDELRSRHEPIGRKFLERFGDCGIDMRRHSGP